MHHQQLGDQRLTGLESQSRHQFPPVTQKLGSFWTRRRLHGLKSRRAQVYVVPSGRGIFILGGRQPAFPRAGMAVPMR